MMIDQRFKATYKCHVCGKEMTNFSHVNIPYVDIFGGGTFFMYVVGRIADKGKDYKCYSCKSSYRLANIELEIDAEKDNI